MSAARREALCFPRHPALTSSSMPSRARPAAPCRRRSEFTALSARGPRATVSKSPVVSAPGPFLRSRSNADATLGSVLSGWSGSVIGTGGAPYSLSEPTTSATSPLDAPASRMLSSLASGRVMDISPSASPSKSSENCLGRRFSAREEPRSIAPRIRLSRMLLKRPGSSRAVPPTPSVIRGGAALAGARHRGSSLGEIRMPRWPRGCHSVGASWGAARRRASGPPLRRAAGAS